MTNNKIRTEIYNDVEKTVNGLMDRVAKESFAYIEIENIEKQLIKKGPRNMAEEDLKKWSMKLYQLLWSVDNIANFDEHIRKYQKYILKFKTDFSEASNITKIKDREK